MSVCKHRFPNHLSAIRAKEKSPVTQSLAGIRREIPEAVRPVSVLLSSHVQARHHQVVYTWDTFTE